MVADYELLFELLFAELVVGDHLPEVDEFLLVESVGGVLVELVDVTLHLVDPLVVQVLGQVESRLALLELEAGDRHAQK